MQTWSLSLSESSRPPPAMSLGCRHFQDEWLKPLKGTYQAGAWQICHGFELGIDHLGWEQSRKNMENPNFLPLCAAFVGRPYK